MKIKIKPEDQAFSKYLRAKHPVCQACHKRSSSEVHHFIHRRHQAGRFSEDNCWAVCFTCHRKFEEDPEWAVKKQKCRFLSEDEYNEFYVAMQRVMQRKKFEFKIIQKHFEDEYEKITGGKK